MSHHPRLLIPTLAPRLLMAFAILSCPLLATAVTIAWDDGYTGLGNKQWTQSLNWSPNVLPAAGDDVIIGNLAAAQGDATLINQDFTIGSLTLMSGASADTSSNFLQINGPLDIGLASRMIISRHNSGPSTPSFQMGGPISIANLGSFDIRGGFARLGGSVTVSLGGAFEGYGDFQFTNGLGSATTIFTNNGSLRTGRASGAAANEHFILRLRANDADGFIDLDGVNDNRVVNIVENTTLDLDMSIRTFRGTMTMAASSVFDAQPGLVSSGGAVFEINAATANAGVPATATIRGESLNLSDATINVNTGTLVIESDLTGNALSSIVLDPNSTLQLDGDVTYSGTLTRSATGRNDWIINGNTELSGGAIHWGLSAVDDTVINDGGELRMVGDFNVGTLSENKYHGEIFLNRGRLTLPTLINAPVLAGRVNVTTSSGVSQIVGKAIYEDTISVTGNGYANFNQAVTLQDAGRFALQGNMRTFNTVTFGSGALNFGAGNWIFLGAATVDANTTIDLSSGIFDLSSNPTSRTHELNADWTIEADSLGGSVGGNQPVTFDINNVNVTLTVNLTNPADGWTLGPLGTLNVRTPGSLSTSLAGSDVRIEGRVNVEHSQRFVARVDLAQTGIIDLRTASTVFYLNGGSTGELNTISGGFINGAGILRSSLSGLTGFGTINPDIGFTGGADLMANGGTLVINGDIQSADVVRVEQAGTLRVNTPLDTGNMNELQMRGGRLVATTLTNSGFLEGYGTVEANSLTNIGSIRGATGQTLIIDTVQPPNLDGIDGVNLFGTVEARFGSITIVDPLADAYSSTALVAADQVLDFQAGWRLDNAGTLDFLGFNTPAVLRGGTTFLEGMVDVDRLGAIEARTLLQSTARVTLNDIDDQLLLRDHTTIAIGATFSGNGKIVNEAGARLEALSGAIVMVDVVNAGELDINNAPGTIALRSFQQLATGEFDLDLGSAATESYQRMLLVEDGLLDGTLSVGLLGGFAPRSAITLRSSRPVSERSPVSLPRPTCLLWAMAWTGSSITRTPRPWSCGWSRPSCRVTLT